jgi:hypothetical protein
MVYDRRRDVRQQLLNRAGRLRKQLVYLITRSVGVQIMVFLVIAHRYTKALQYHLVSLDGKVLHALVAILSNINLTGVMALNQVGPLAHKTRHGVQREITLYARELDVRLILQR